MNGLFIRNTVIILFLALTFVCCKSKQRGIETKDSDPKFAAYKKEMNAIGEYRFGDTNLFSRSLFCILEQQSTVTNIIVVAELKGDPFSTVSFAVVKYDSYDRQKVSLKHKFELPYMAVKTVRKISKEQSQKIFSFCDKYVNEGAFYPLGKSIPKSGEEGNIVDLADFVLYSNKDRMYEYNFHGHNVDSLYLFIDSICNYKKMSAELNYPWIDDSGFLTQDWRWDTLPAVKNNQ